MKLFKYADRDLAIILVAGMGVWELIPGLQQIPGVGLQTEIVRQIITMEATFEPDSWRAVHNPAVITLFAVMIWLAHLSSGVLSLAGAAYMIRGRTGATAALGPAINLALAGVGIACILYLVGFSTIAEGWFLMWQAPRPPNYHNEAIQKFLSAMGIVIYLAVLKKG